MDWTLHRQISAGHPTAKRSTQNEETEMKWLKTAQPRGLPQRKAKAATIVRDVPKHWPTFGTESICFCLFRTRPSIVVPIRSFVLYDLVA